MLVITDRICDFVYGQISTSSINVKEIITRIKSWIHHVVGIYQR